ncbi:hypothetical protein E3N88_35859 [Mikania micrantha]|uniref:Uncharacterized protein n=1 Tax=Mikania micrantha TaxID=192012 RepID=A0A5N6M242_9ASTR|nr:hypothetical protein E3N88_35859 [Mikania micrantha]
MKNHLKRCKQEDGRKRPIEKGANIIKERKLQRAGEPRINGRRQAKTIVDEKGIAGSVKDGCKSAKIEIIRSLAGQFSDSIIDTTEVVAAMAVLSSLL